MKERSLSLSMLHLDLWLRHLSDVGVLSAEEIMFRAIGAL
jgi:hypothetical protein